MKQFIKLIVLILIGLALNGCYNAQEKEAIEICKKKSCKYPLTFEVINLHNKSNSNYLICKNKKSSNKTIYTGPRGGKYHYSKSGKKVYRKRK